MALVGIGMGIGIGLALGVSRLMSGFLYGVSPFDLASFIGPPTFLGIIALLACYLPARRATKVHPMVALRAE